MNTPTYIEQHYTFSVSEFEGLWEMTFKHPFNKVEHLSIYVKAPNTNAFSKPKDDRQIVEPGPRLTEVMSQLLYEIESYPYSWDFAGKKIVSFGYDFESDLNMDRLNSIDLTEIAFKTVIEHFNFFSPLLADLVAEGDKVSGKGVMAKLKITLDKPKTVNHLSLDFFAEYPLELMSLMYQEDESKEAAVYEIPLQSAVQSNSSTYLHFSPVFAKVFYLIIKQESYSLMNAATSQKQLDEKELWSQASTNSKQIYDTVVANYVGELFSSASSIQLHQEVMDSYKNTMKGVPAPQSGSLNAYRSDFVHAKKRMDSEQR